MFPKVIVFTSTEVGDIETINNPRPKNELKISPITASSFKSVLCFKNNIAPAASPPEKKAPKEKGRPIK